MKCFYFHRIVIGPLLPFYSLLLLLCVTRDPVEIWQFSCFKRNTQIFTTKFELVLLPKQWVQEYEKCLTMRFTGCDGRKTKHNFNSFVSCWLSLLHAARQIHIQREFVYMCTTNKHQWKSLFIVCFFCGKIKTLASIHTNSGRRHDMHVYEISKHYNNNAAIIIFIFSFF